MTSDRPSLDARGALDAAAARKTLVMERSVAQLRAMVIGVNILAYFLFIGPSAPRAPLALTIVGVAGAYGLWSLLTRPYERYPLLRFGVVTLVADASLISLWVLATGGPHSEFWIIYMISVVSVAMRYDLRQTIVAALGEASLYAAVMAADGGLSGLGTLVRPSYILLAGMAAGLLARQERVSREESVAFERLAGEHADMLARERETVERLRDLDRMKTDFVATASHELRTPVTVMLGVFETLDRFGDRIDETRRDEFLRRAREQTGRLARLIEDLLTVSRIEEGRVKLDVGNVDAENLVRDAAHSAGVGDVVRVRNLGVSGVACDPARLLRVLVNLLDNARKYSPPGSSIEMEVRPEPGAVRFTVRDHGPGIPPAERDEIFGRFKRAGTGDHVSGVGLGLYIAKGLVEAHGGTIAVEGAPGGGAEFHVVLPQAEPAADEPGDAHRLVS